ncbi:MAG: hypothetical protein Q7J31_01415 [Syntrophales bacterium]|nr:hypothetical protein [Syntrophales bacterium]
MSNSIELDDNACEITEWDLMAYKKLVSIDLTEEQISQLRNPKTVFEREDSIIAIHWHPEMAPVEIVEERIVKMFPNARESLIIPTQHNILMQCGNYSGVEVDCEAKEFNRKIQLLLHFRNESLANANILKSMLEHTFRYRQTQFYEYMETIVNSKYEKRLQKAVRQTGMEEDIVRFVRIYTKKFKKLLDANYSETPIVSIKNKLLTNYFFLLTEFYDQHIIDKAIILLLEVKRVMKRSFSIDYFYEVNEIIEEARRQGAGIIVPHPEQYWPVLLADYDVDGIEVWNPQSREFTEFLINVIIRKNKQRNTSRPLLVMMGDDTHMSEKFLPRHAQSPDKVAREVGYQPAWHEITIIKSLNMGDFDRNRMILEYKNRLK